MAAVVHVPATEPQRLRLRVRGAVQGVGFRPFVYRLARERGLSGWVLNDGAGVLAEVQGARLDEFLSALRAETPPLARIDGIDVESVGLCEEAGFTVEASHQGPVATAITPDVAVCGDCLDELFDPADRRYRYPFLNCTNCGPRYTITRRLPYDRGQTAMAKFPMCEDCAREYHDPLDRRFHAQPTACPVCGPALDMPLEVMVRRLRAGDILAIKGLGGFHLACDARNEETVARLRQRKNREEKPFAIMVANLATARRLAECNPLEAKLLTSARRPIVLLRRRDPNLAPSIAPGLPWLGIMLPYAPLHYLLFHEAAGRPKGVRWLEDPQDLVLVMTSANPGGEPLVIDNRDAERRLGGIADAIAAHNRDIVVRADDSVMRVVDGAPTFVRRARGYAPEGIKLARPAPSVLAVGGYLKNSVCVTRGDEAFVCQHIGDLDNAEAIRFFEETVGHLLHVLGAEPVLVAHDLHPDFYSTRFAQGLGLPAVAVQHHHAHVASVIAEHRVTEPALGLALDGFGLGPDGDAWGGELLRIEGSSYRRLGHLDLLKQPGGDTAARQPWRMGAAVLDRLGRCNEIPVRYADQPGAGLVAQMLQKGVNTPKTSSCGRLFDAACGLLGVQPRASYEGQAPMRLEGLVTHPEVMPGGWRIENGVLSLLPVLERLLDCDPVSGANLFHGTLIMALADWVERASREVGLRTVALSGGCLLNHVVANGLVCALSERGLAPLVARQVPPNDGGLSLGQAWVAAQSWR